MTPSVDFVKSFAWKHLPVPAYTAERKTINGTRMYVTDDEVFSAPSVTTVLGCRNKKALFEWRKAVGNDAANAISKKASTGGTRLHAMCESYLIGGKPFDLALKKVMPETLARFKNFKSFLDTIDLVYVLEEKLLSTKLMIGGTVDCIAEIDGKVWIIDFKTSRRMKQREDIPAYFAQGTAYAYMFYEMYGIKVDGIKIAISVEGIAEPVIYEAEPAEYLPYLIESKKMYDRGEID